MSRPDTRRLPPGNHLWLFAGLAVIGLTMSIVGAVRASPVLLAAGFPLPWVGFAVATKLDRLW